MVRAGDPGEDSSMVPPEAGGEQGQAGQHRGPKWCLLQPGRDSRGAELYNT